MGITIRKIIFKNYKRFRNFELEPNKNINVLVGDNEVGKSSILDAIDLVAMGSSRRVLNIGLDNLLNVEAVKEGILKKKYIDLPELIIELYLEGNFDHTMNGNNNTLQEITDGIRLVCSPNDDYINEINEILMSANPDFPYEFYKIRFSTFADEEYTGYKKKLKTVLINNSNLDSEYATNDFIERIYNQYTSDDMAERVKHRSSYRQMKSQYSQFYLDDLNKRIPDKYEFGLQNSYTKIFSKDLMIYENSIAINNKGTGKQVIIKTDFALKKAGENVDVILIEEPENHLSSVNLKKLINKISNEREAQIFISTHNSQISTGLELNNVIMLSKENAKSGLSLRNLDVETSNYFLKAPPASVLEFILSPKVILVEGPSEYILFNKFYNEITGSTLEDDSITVIAIRGLSFKRYLEVAKITQHKIAVVTDNDGDFQKNIVERYKEFNEFSNMFFFFDKNNDLKTFEHHLYECNKQFYDNDKDREDTIKWLVANKTKNALDLTNADSIVVPEYIKNAILWIRS